MATISRLLLILLVSALTLNASGQDSLFVGADEAMISPGAVTHLEVDCQRDDYKLVFRDISLFNSLEVLWIREYRESTFPRAFFLDLNVIELIFESCNKLHLTKVFRDMAACPVEKLNFRNCKISVLPVNMLPQTITGLIVTDCPGIEFQGRLEQPRLADVVLTQDGLSEPPGFLENLETLEGLDLSSNHLSRIPAYLFSFSGLERLDMRGNPLSEPIEEIRGAGFSALKIFCLDIPQDTSGLANIINSASFNLALLLGEDTLGRIPGEAPIRETPVFAELRVMGSQVSVLSEAYLHYEEVMGDSRFSYRFDSLLYDERYLDPVYANGLLVNPNSWESPIDMRPHFPSLGKNFRVKFVPRSKQRQRAFYREYPEFTAFRRIAWQYDGNLNAGEFRKQYDRDAMRMDLRLKFEEGMNSVILEFKTQSGFEQIPVYPVVAKGKTTKGYSPDMESLFQRYDKQRSRRIERFNRRLIRQKKQYDRRLERRRDVAWQQFQAMYFSPEEKAMSREAWMVYYLKVKEDESSALRNSPARAANMKAALGLLGYSEMQATAYVRNFGDTLRRVIRLMSGNEILLAADLIVVDKRNNALLSYSFEEYELDNLVNIPAGNVIIIAELVNGDIALTRWNSLEAARISGVVPLQMEVIKDPLHSVGQILESYDL